MAWHAGVILGVGLGLATLAGEPFAVPLRNGSFEEGLDPSGVPSGWHRYAGGGRDQALRLMDAGAGVAGKALLIEDGDSTAEIGITQGFPLQPGVNYRATAKIRAVAGADSTGAYLQLRFLPSNELVQTALATEVVEEFEDAFVVGLAPAGTTSGALYLYTHREPVPKVIVDAVTVVGGVEGTPLGGAVPAPVPPVYTTVRDLHLDTDLVRDGKPAAVIVAPAAGIYARQAEQIQQAIARQTGTVVPVVSDATPGVALPPSTHAIVLGNRSTNRLVRALYDLYYTLTDLKYPGPGGYELRTLHDPFGNGFNAVLVGGSDAAGVDAAAAKLVEKLQAVAAAPGRLTVGWLLDARLGQGLTVPSKLTEVETWGASLGYGSVGYFGWNSISKRMALYYMTGDTFQAREVVRLAFPDAQALKEIDEIDGERIEGKKDPLAEPYHYNAHQMILFWDLIEESPIFTAEERLSITNAFSRQLAKRAPEGVYGLTTAPAAVGSRHGQWSAISLYCLGRYFQKYYPAPVWDQAVRGGRLHFASLHKHAWLMGESDNLFWYNTGIAPILTYMVLTGDRKPLDNGVLPLLLRGQEALLNGASDDENLRSAALDFLNQAVYLTGDGRWSYYRERTGLKTDILRVGQSFWPEEELRPKPPADLFGTWTVNPLPKPGWPERRSGLPLDQSFLFASFRTAADPSGDFTLLDGFNGASRNPYHAFAILALRLAGTALLQGYMNQVLTSADGMVEPTVAMDAGLLYRDVLGDVTVAVAAVPKAAFCDWRRTLVSRVGQFALIVDDLAFRTDSQNMSAVTWWDTRGGSWNRDLEAVVFPAGQQGELPAGWFRRGAIEAECQSGPAAVELKPLPGLSLMLLRATDPGAWLEMAFEVAQPVAGTVFADLVNYSDRGRVRISLDGAMVTEAEHYAETVVRNRVSLGVTTLAAGQHRLRVETVARHEGADRCYVGLAGVCVGPEGAAAPDPGGVWQLCPAEALTVSGQGQIRMEWTGPARQGEHRLFFHLLGRDLPSTPPAVACATVAGNAAAFELSHGPGPALAVVGDYDGCQGEFVLIARDLVYGHNLVRAGLPGDPVLAADVPLDLSWDYRGPIHLSAARDVTLTLGRACRGLQGLVVDDHGATLEPAPESGPRLRIPAGRHVLKPVPSWPPAMAEAVERLAAGLTQYVARGREERSRLHRTAAGGPAAAAGASWQPVRTVALGGQVTQLLAIPVPGQDPLLAAVTGKTLRLLTADGRDLRTLDADANIRVAHWWPEPGLLLAGCVDETVIAFDLDGRRRWVFTSQMDPAVYEAAKTYWFKSAPGHEGIHGLHTGVFVDGKTQCFVGSACTLEVLDGTGSLVKRLPVFWGPGWRFALLPGPQDSVDLLIARNPTDSHALAILNSRTWAQRRGFDGVPPGHTYVGGWACMARAHIFCEDLDGDGVQEVASEINGTWNRVTVWSRDGTPLHNAQFGPGRSIPYRNLRDMDVTDLNGDGRKEMVVATAGGLVVALDCTCQKVWSTRLPAPPSVLACIARGDAARPLVVVGCDDGSIVGLDAGGTPVLAGQANGRLAALAVIDGPEGRRLAVGSEKGDLVLLPVR